MTEMVATDLEYSPESLLFRASSAVSLYAYVPIVSAVGGGHSHPEPEMGHHLHISGCSPP